MPKRGSKVPTNCVIRFMQFVSDPIGPLGCREWLGARDKDGYGRIRVARKRYRAHVAAAIAKFGPVPDGKETCHTCDNPPCVLTDHLFYATPKENQQDAVSKGRKAHNHTAKKLTIEQVHKIKCAVGTCDQLAIVYQVSSSMIANIRSGRAWSNIIVEKPTGNRNNCKLTIDQIRLIKSCQSPDMVYVRMFGISKSQVNRIRHGLSWKEVEVVDETKVGGR